MSGPVETITEAPTSEAIHNVDADVDAHTPATPVTPPADADDGLSAIRESVATLATAVAVLTDTVAGLGGHDHNPVASVPWTHRGSSHHDADE